MKVTVNFHNHQLKEGAQEGTPKVDRVPDKFCISHSAELAILKPPRFIANWNISNKHTLLRRGSYWYLIHKILNERNWRVWDDWKRERRGFPPSFSASHCCLYASLSPLLGFVETQRDLWEEEKNAKLQVNALRKQSFEWVYFYSRTSWKRPPNGCQDLVVAYGRWSLTRIGQQKVSFENRPCTFWKKIRCMQIISFDMLWRSSYPLSSEADTVN